jgi:NADH-quinone oxidoreductase subunit N
MTPIVFNLSAVIPEIVLLIGACFVLLADVFFAGKLDADGKSSSVKYFATHRLAVYVIGLTIIALVFAYGQAPGYAFGKMYVADDFGALLKICAAIATIVTIIYARDYAAQRDMHKGELYALALFSLLGQMVMISANNLLVVYLGLELMSLSLYSLAALRRDNAQATEAAMKYFVLGALASGFLLYGMSMIYGGTGSLDLGTIAKAFTKTETNKLVLTFGVVFLVSGLAFKFGAVPFHMWVPDVYQGTPTAVTLLISGAPKLAAFAITFRILAEGLIGVANDWQQMLMVLSVASLVLGNLVAIAQTNLKRMLAYSTIAQVGFVLLGFVAGVAKDGSTANAATAYGASMYYIIAYVLTTLGTFGVIQVLARHGFEAEEIHDLKGLSKRSPWLAVVMLVLMVSLMGIPPTAGFFAKLSVITAVIKAGHVWLAVLAVMMSLVGAFYYLRVIKTMFADEPMDRAEIKPSSEVAATLAFNGAMVFIVGVAASPLITACTAAIKQAMAN